MGDEESPQNTRPNDSSNPNTRPNDSYNLYMPYMGLGPTSILKIYFMYALHM